MNVIVVFEESDVEGKHVAKIDVSAVTGLPISVVILVGKSGEVVAGACGGVVLGDLGLIL